LRPGGFGSAFGWFFENGRRLTLQRSQRVFQFFKEMLVLCQRLLQLVLQRLDLGGQRFLFGRTHPPYNTSPFLYFRNGKLLFHPNEQTAELGIPIPLNSEAFATAANILLAVSNDDMLVIDCYRRPTSAGGAERTFFKFMTKSLRAGRASI